MSEVEPDAVLTVSVMDEGVSSQDSTQNGVDTDSDDEISHIMSSITDEKLLYNPRAPHPASEVHRVKRKKKTLSFHFPPATAMATSPLLSPLQSHAPTFFHLHAKSGLRF